MKNINVYPVGDYVQFDPTTEKTGLDVVAALNMLNVEFYAPRSTGHRNGLSNIDCDNYVMQSLG